jgi:K+/H+ antiporter YhaU regulatory subunit KhtT
MTRQGHTEINPGPETTIQDGDVLVLLGGEAQIDRAIEEIIGVREAV